jgi:hypothetical protein
MSKQSPNINRLDDYVSAFYEDNIENKLKASKEVLALFQDFSNLEALIEHGISFSYSRVIASSPQSYLSLKS